MLAVSLATVAARAEEPVVVITHPATRVQSLSRGAVQAIFSMRLASWPDGNPVRVFVLPDSQPVHIAFSKEVLGIFPHQLRQAWDRLVFSGTGQAPTEVATPEEMLNAVATTPGAIGYSKRNTIDERVRVLPLR